MQHHKGEIAVKKRFILLVAIFLVPLTSRAEHFISLNGRIVSSVATRPYAPTYSTQQNYGASTNYGGNNVNYGPSTNYGGTNTNYGPSTNYSGTNTNHAPATSYGGTNYNHDYSTNYGGTNFNYRSATNHGGTNYDRSQPIPKGWSTNDSDFYLTRPAPGGTIILRRKP